MTSAIPLRLFITQRAVEKLVTSIFVALRRTEDAIAHGIKSPAAVVTSATLVAYSQHCRFRGRL